MGGAWRADFCSTQPQVTQDDCENCCLLPSCRCCGLLESSSSESGSREGFRGPGLFFSPIEVDPACTAGSPLGAKLASAFETCLGGEEALKPEEVGASETERRRRRPNKGKKCPTV